MEREITMPTFIEVVKKYFNDDEINTIIEVGAMDCKDSLYFKEIFSNANVYCIEGLPDNYQNYIKDLTTIKHYNTIITNFDGQINFHKKNINGIHSIFDRGTTYGNIILENQKCLSLKTFCKNENINKIDLMKIDVEGATYEVLEGMGNLLHTIKIMHIETETYPFFIGQKLHDEVCDFLTRNNFTLIKLSEVFIVDKHKQHDSIWVNNLFLK